MSPAHESFMRAWQKDFLRIISELEQKQQAMNPQPSQHTTSPGLRHLDEAVKKVLYFSEHNTPPARRAHPADRVTDNRETFRRKFRRMSEAANFTEAG